MLQFIDGKIVLTDFSVDEQLYYDEYIKEFESISITQFRGSAEYQPIYVAIQLMLENGTITNDVINKIINAPDSVNKYISLPAVLHSRVASRFLEDGYIATVEQVDVENKGVLSICVDYKSDNGGDIDKSIAKLIVNEMLPAGSYIAGDIEVTVVLSNNQPVLARWRAPEYKDVDFKITLIVNKNSSFPVDTVDVIVSRFIDNFNNLNQMGLDITTSLYYQIDKDAPWASSIKLEYRFSDDDDYTTDIYSASFFEKFNPKLDPVNVFIEG